MKQLNISRYRNNERAFTLIELLVVVAIIGILATLTLINVSHIRAKSRDIQRVTDIKTIQEALAMYENSYAQYPIYEGYITGSDDMSTALEGDNLLQSVPVDPININEGGIDYRYYYKSDSGDDYLIRFYLETNSVHSRSQGLNTVAP